MLVIGTAKDACSTSLYHMNNSYVTDRFWSPISVSHSLEIITLYIEKAALNTVTTRTHLTIMTVQHLTLDVMVLHNQHVSHL